MKQRRQFEAHLMKVLQNTRIIYVTKIISYSAVTISDIYKYPVWDMLYPIGWWNCCQCRVNKQCSCVDRTLRSFHYSTRISCIIGWFANHHDSTQLDYDARMRLWWFSTLTLTWSLDSNAFHDDDADVRWGSLIWLDEGPQRIPWYKPLSTYTPCRFSSHVTDRVSRDRRGRVLALHARGCKVQFGSYTRLPHHACSWVQDLNRGCIKY